MPAIQGDNWQSLSDQLDIAFEMPEQERPQWLAALSARDPQTATRVARILELRERRDFLDFLVTPLPLPAEEMAASSLVGRHVGAYVIEAEVGRGGMGSVWRARRADGRYEGTVAIKFVNAVWTGQAGERRFQLEGRVLGKLNHPNIARLVDAGVLDEVQPYLVIEFVEGEPIDGYCNRQQLGLEARITLFLNVLQAVAHAHNNLIVHRDIKPSNVFVTRDAIVKLLDFGIAKLIDDEEGSAAATRSSAVALTPQYAAPEQLLGQPITTATDVYSLGQLLYLLLTGTPPLPDSARSKAELLKFAIMNDAPRASTAAALQEICGRSLAGDLDNILHKAMKKLPLERYTSADAFADDLKRFLAHQPIQARPDTIAYRVGKLVRRHRVGTALASFAVIALSASLLAAALQATRATRAAAQANIERARADAQRDLAIAGIEQTQDTLDLAFYLFGEALPADQAEGRKAVLLKGANFVRGEKGIPLGRRAQMLELLGTEFKVQRDYEQAAQLFSEAHTAAIEAAERGVMSSSLCKLGDMHAQQGHAADGLAEVKRGLADVPDDAKFADPRVLCLLSEASTLSVQGQSAIPALEAAQKALSDLLVPDKGLELDISGLLASSYSRAMRVVFAQRAFAREQQLLDEAGKMQSGPGVVHFTNQGMFFWRIGQPLDARDSLARAQDLDRQRGTQDIDSPAALLLSARIARQLGDGPTAVERFARTLQHARELHDWPVEGAALGEQVAALRESGSLARAARELAEAEPLLHKGFGPTHFVFGMLRMESALLAEGRGESVQAQQLANEAVALLADNPNRAFALPLVLVQRAGLAQRAGRFDAARADSERALALYDESFGKDVRSASIGDALLTAGQARASQGDLHVAHSYFALAALHFDSSLGSQNQKTHTARELAAR